jgi:hypothetical protein
LVIEFQSVQETLKAIIQVFGVLLGFHGILTTFILGSLQNTIDNAQKEMESSGNAVEVLMASGDDTSRRQAETFQANLHRAKINHDITTRTMRYMLSCVCGVFMLILTGLIGVTRFSGYLSIKDPSSRLAFVLNSSISFLAISGILIILQVFLYIFLPRYLAGKLLT